MDAENDVLLEVYSSAGDPYFGNIYFANDSNTNTRLYKQKQNSYRFTLTDEDDEIMDLNGKEIVFTLKFMKLDSTFRQMQKDFMKFQVNEALLNN